MSKYTFRVYTFRVDTPHGYEITTLAAESIAAAKAEVMKRSRRDSIDVSLIGIRSLTPQIPLVNCCICAAMGATGHNQRHTLCRAHD